MNINLQELGLDLSLFQTIVDSPELFASTGKQTRITVGKEINYPLTINKKPYDAKLFVHSANLQRVSLVENTQIGTDRNYYIVTGIFNPVKMDVILTINGTDINLVDFLFLVTKQAANSDDYTREEFINHLSNIRFPLHAGMPMFFQQMGANKTEYFKVVEILAKAGGIEDTKGNGRIIHSCGLTRDMTQHGVYGPKVLSFEVGTTDPTQTALYKWAERNNVNIGDTGFINFGEAIVKQFTRLSAQRKTAAIIREQQEQAGLTQEEINKMKAQVKNLNEMATQWASVWGGSQQRWTRQQDGDFVQENIFDPINVPCGNFGLSVDGKVVNINLWTNKADNAQEATNTNVESAIKNAVESFSK